MFESSLPSGYGFYDKLASTGIGLNGFFELTLPLSQDEDYVFFTSKLKLRYTHSIWFDEKGRNLDEYFQEFLSTYVSVGLGYSF